MKPFASATLLFFVGLVLLGAGAENTGAMFMIGSPVWGLLYHDRLSEREATKKQKRKRWKDKIVAERRLEELKLLEGLERHIHVLQRKLAQSRQENDYGFVVADKTDEILEEFFRSCHLNHDLVSFSAAREIALEAVEAHKAKQNRAGFDPTSFPHDGHEFEHWVAAELGKLGWKANVTVGSGDQGIDVIAERSKKRLGIQCKRSSRPIGNSAVQEAYSGKAYYSLDAVCVLSNQTYTNSAKTIADQTGVCLVSQYDIPALHSLVFGARK
ncbi:restriction endonuclease [uncultured Aliiroseovarius sp.]|uniref:restriction endonuclease n=1 Tax=uncultured Aliiroseovarius sp. TaxID=1658783 RepID=UPI002624F894|nr:restriction endonuclease [uncultured Aliiroseovarius sp.]